MESLDSLLKKKFIIGKQHQSVSQIVLQEAIPTAYCKNQGDKFLVAEPVLYLVSGKPAGAFFRTREDLDQDNGILDSLNNPRASFKDLSEEFPPIRSTNCQDKLKENQLYYFLAKLHSLGAALEECPQ